MGDVIEFERPPSPEEEENKKVRKEAVRKITEDKPQLPKPKDKPN